ncbi:hypothetical protein HT136_07850 [Novosphingobium profundi]|uniref:hypothetical protein n=1 Tax=Novosphingobium profundi TaxID=1774954 RepID=UPI001BD91861|nr:hypothetical protein [Novosphingobium profundi]MBT0668279.1 hypothetical protein [Novosphingobium profundi]
MLAHTRALIAAATFAHLTGKKVAGVYDHAEGRDRLIAADARGDAVQGFDGERQAKFGGKLPEIYDEGDKAFIAFRPQGDEVQGHDRSSDSAFTARLTGGVVQVYDHGAQAWFSYDIQNPDAAMSYYSAAMPAA